MKVEQSGYFEIIISGKKGNLTLKPDTYDIKELRLLLEDVEKLIPFDKDRPLITFELGEGSVKGKVKTLLQYIVMLNALIGQIDTGKSIDFLNSSASKAIENFQKTAKEKNYQFEIRTSVPSTNTLKITKETNFYKSEEIWVDSEFYFYGKITNAGGKDKPNIHLLTKDEGTLFIETPKQVLEKLEDNIIYKDYGIRATGKQNISTGEIDKHTLKFLELITYNPKYDEKYLNKIIDRVSETWGGKVNADEWLDRVRGRI